MAKVLIVNKFYYPRGGDCVCAINLNNLLQREGHETAIYAMDYSENIDTEWNGYFASEVSFSGGIKNLLKGVERTLGLGDIRSSFQRILDDFKPDVVHLNNIHSYLSPVLAKMSKKAGAKVVWTLHDYKLVCPSYSCLANGELCEACIGESKLNVLKKRCMKSSLPASAVAWIEALRWNRRTLESNVDTFICPSDFMRSKMEQGGFDKQKLVTLCNFVDPVKLSLLTSNDTAPHTPGTYCYVGRLSAEKGVDVLLDVASQLPYKLYVAGDGPMGSMLREKYKNSSNIEFLGRLDAQGVADLLSRVYASIIPSRCYENNPLGVIESLSAGTPVIGAAIGGIPELIKPWCGSSYTWNDRASMREAIEGVMNAQWDNVEISRRAIELFSPQAHYDKLIQIYEASSTK